MLYSIKFWTKFSSDFDFVNSQKFRHFCQAEFCQIRNEGMIKNINELKLEFLSELKDQIKKRDF